MLKGRQVKPDSSSVHVGAVLNLLAEWARWEPEGPPFVLDADREFAQSARSGGKVAEFCSWQAAIEHSDFCNPNDTRLHLGLLPMPFIGDLRRASIYVLMLNPGWGPHDYFGEYKVPEYRRALLSNLKQEFDGAMPFLFLDPRYSWHGGFRWWHGKLEQVILWLSQSWKVSFADARARLGTQLAGIELFPYHSSSFRGPRGWKQLKSVELMWNFVQTIVVPKVKRGEAIAIAARRAGMWDLPNLRGIVRYTGGQARGAHLTPDSSGGRLILARLLKAGRPRTDQR